MPEPIATWNGARGVWERLETNILCEHAALYSGTWPASGMTLGGRLYPLPTPAPRTAGNGSSSPPGLLPTPRTADGMHSTMEANRNRMERHREAGTRAWRGTIEEAVWLLPTPLVTNRAGMSPSPASIAGKRGTDLGPAIGELLKTPTAQLAVNGGSQHPDKRRQGGHGPTLADQVEHTLLPTPRATDGTKGGPNQRGSSGDLMPPSAVAHLLPTPTAVDYKGPNPPARDRDGKPRPLSDDDLPTSVARLLPTPTAQAAKHAEVAPSETRRLDDSNLWVVAARIGDRTPPRLHGGKLPPAAQLPAQLSLDEPGSD